MRSCGIAAWRSVPVGALVGLCLACGGVQSPTPSPLPVITPLEGFSSDRAWQHLETLAALAPRAPGSAPADAARAYIRRELERHDGLSVEPIVSTLEVDGAQEITLEHVAATIHGASLDRFVLIAPYASDVAGTAGDEAAVDDASGAALLLEVARILAEASLPYTVQLLFVEGAGRPSRSDASERSGAGADGLAEAMREAGHLDGVRLLVAFQRVCDPDLRIARDISSQRHHREAFFDAARALGHADAFRPDQGFESVEATHLAFARRGVRPVVAIVDTARADGDLDAEGRAVSHCAPESLEVVGSVTLAALDRIGRRLAKIDRFTEMPLADAEDRRSMPPQSDDASATTREDDEDGDGV